MVETMLAAIHKEYPMKALPAGEYASMKVSGMKFNIRHYEAKGLGHVSAMTASGFFGLMKMDTVIITPTELDMPLLSYDRVLAMGNDTLIFELYDTFAAPGALPSLCDAQAAMRSLPEHDLGAHWYDNIKLPVSVSKKGKKKHTDAFDTAVRDYLCAYLRDAKHAAPCEADTKREKASVYVEGLLKNGGPSTDVFKKGVGEEKTAELFRRILFGTQA